MEKVLDKNDGDNLTSQLKAIEEILIRANLCTVEEIYELTLKHREEMREVEEHQRYCSRGY